METNCFIKHNPAGINLLSGEPQRGSRMSSPGCWEAEPGVMIATHLNRSAVRHCCLHDLPSISLPRCGAVTGKKRLPNLNPIPSPAPQ